MEETNANNYSGKPPILFITTEHIMKLLNKSKTTASNHLSLMRQRYHVVKPSKVTLDMACDYFTITTKQFYEKYYG